MNYFFGFSYWKHNFLKPFLKNINNVIFINPFFKKNYFKLAIKKGLTPQANIYVWGKKSFPEIELYAKENNIKIKRVEDGFIRSVGLGSDLTQAYSLVIDSKGIYFDPNQESDLEYLLQNKNFDKKMLERAEKLKNYIISKKISKYNLYDNQTLNIQTNKQIVLVPGQVEDDASIKFGASGMTNLELLKQTRHNVPDAYIIYKPHPDVLAGNRVGSIDNKIVLNYANKIVTDISLDSVLEISDEVHTMTSLVGFEGLIRGKKVYTYGMPFYAGWGLTKDSHISKRRTKKLTVNEIVYSVFIAYPIYIHPQTLDVCSPEKLLEALDKEKLSYNSSSYLRLKLKIKNLMSRKIQFILRFISLK